MDNRKKIFDMSKNLPLLSRILKSVCELLRVVTSYLRIPATYLRMLAIDSELAIRKDSYENSVYVCEGGIKYFSQGIAKRPPYLV